MADNAKKSSELPRATVLIGNDHIVVLSNTTLNATSNAIINCTTKIISYDNLFANVKTSNLVLTYNTTPANSTVNTVAGSLWSDGSYIYYSTSANTIKRVALSSF